MQTITLNANNASVLNLEDSVVVDVQADRIVFPELNTTILFDSFGDSTLHTGVTLPGDWEPHKYLYDGVSWSANPDFSG